MERREHSRSGFFKDSQTKVLHVNIFAIIHRVYYSLVLTVFQQVSLLLTVHDNLHIGIKLHVCESQTVDLIDNDCQSIIFQLNQAKIKVNFYPRFRLTVPKNRLTVLKSIWKLVKKQIDSRDFSTPKVPKNGTYGLPYEISWITVKFDFLIQIF